MNKKIVVENHSEAMKLIESGVNSMMIFSKEAPYGYKKDGTPAARRGRKPLDPAIKAAREEKSATSGRKKSGPIVRTAEAPYGVKKDGTPMKKRGRPPKASKELTVLTTVPVVDTPTTETAIETDEKNNLVNDELLTEITLENTQESCEPISNVG
jgi:hypothetical protein